MFLEESVEPGQKIAAELESSPSAVRPVELQLAAGHGMSSRVSITVVPAVAIIATAPETLFGLLLVGKLVSLLYSSGFLMTAFALTMTIGLGVKASLGFFGCRASISLGLLCGVSLRRG